MTRADDKQRAYYEGTAVNYGIHVQLGDEDYIAMEYMVGLMAIVRT
jgi:hypothetical protein